MGIVRANLELESYFNNSGINWSCLNDKEYRTLIKGWMSSFDDALSSGSITKGEKGITLLREKIPFNCYIFNSPNYSKLPRSKGKGVPVYTYAYKVYELLGFDREVLNSAEVILCQEDFKFMCAFNHEAPLMIPEVYCEI